MPFLITIVSIKFYAAHKNALPALIAIYFLPIW